MKEPQTLEINVQEPYFSFIKSGQKIVEGRLAKEKFTNLKTGDFLLINNEIKKEIVEITLYKTFTDMLVMEGVKNTIPDAQNLQEGVSVYYKFFTPEDEKNIGVCAIKFK
jgi:ASC-1-like (ASCH) protein